ncbi:MAG: 2'-5' RNA ligase family protein [Thermoleophilia bacterium]
MTSTATVEGDGRLRLFLGFPLDPAWAADLARWQARELGGSPALGLVPVERLHVTLAFLGSRPAADAARAVEVAGAVAPGFGPPALAPVHYRETRSVAMLVLDDAGGRAGALQGALSSALAAAGLYEPESRPWLPHVTVARMHGRPPRLDPSVPALGPTSPSGVALYNSVLRPNGAQYQILVSVPLGG